MENRLSPTHAKLLEKHSIAIDELNESNGFLATWQALVDYENDNSLPNLNTFRTFEDYAVAAIITLVESHTKTSDSPFITSSKRHHRDYAAVIISQHWNIEKANATALNTLKLENDTNLLDAIKLHGKQDLTLITTNDVNENVFKLMHAESTLHSAPITLAISKVASNNLNESLFLILFISPPNPAHTANILAKKFELTTSEEDILTGFIEGESLQNIATNINCSYSFVRDHFITVLEKSHCSSQSELLRLVVSLSFMSSDIKAKQPQYGYHKKLTLPRPKGRVVELVLSGDKFGTPILNIPSLFGHGITPSINQKLSENSFLYISMLRPGFGQTSMPSAGDDLYDCLVGDVRAVLDSLEIQQCTFIARASASRSFYYLVSHLSDRIQTGIIVNGFIPKQYLRGSLLSTWSGALMRAPVVSYPIAKLVLGTARSLFMRSDPVSFLQRMYKGSMTDHQHLSNLEIAFSIRQGVKSSSQQGLEAGTQDVVDCFQDWSHCLKNISTPIIVYHGTDDPHTPIKGVRKFVSDNKNYLSLVEESKGGGQLVYSHIDTILSLIRSSMEH